MGSQLAIAGVPIRTIAEILGHRKVKMTLSYAHLAPEHLEDAMAALAALPTGTISATGKSGASRK